MPKAAEKDLFRFIQFKEAAFLQLRNAAQTVCRKFYVDGAVAVFYDSISKSVKVNGSSATALSDSFYNSFSEDAIQYIKLDKLSNNAHSNAADNVSFSLRPEEDRTLMDSITMRYKDFILKHPGSYLSVELTNFCTDKLPKRDLYYLLQSLNPAIRKHSFTKWQLHQLQQRISFGEPEALPVFNVVDAREKIFQSKDLQQGIFLIDFWGTWCGPCIAAMPKLVQLANKFDGKVQFISYAMQINSTPTAFETAERKYGIRWSSFYENRNIPTGIADVFKIEGYPTYLLIKDGIILKKSLSARGLPQIESMIERLLKEEAKKND